ncbi:MAG TPA: SAM-dependent methyltransferase [Acidimicrobiales bacterium]|nr:SAM-dependent methyltransferase [Acidimicrobiales bacterium]
MPFDVFMDVALYDPEAGFYATGHGAGRAGDFLTSPEVGPLFGAVVARAADVWWDRLGRPERFTVVEAGAGAGTLARDVRAGRPRCADSLVQVLVERSPALRDLHPERVPVEAGAVVSLAEMPAEPVVGVVLANELLDNLPFLLLERGDGTWCEVRVGDDGGALTEVLVPATPELADEADRLAPGAAPGARVPLQHIAAEWLRDALALVDRGRVVVIDYADTTPSMAGRPWSEWLRTYRGHGRGRHPLEAPGDQDVTAEVAVDQLAHVRPPDRERSQAEFLAEHGIDELAAAAAEEWRARAHVGDLAALKARSRAGEADALTDPVGLGAFRVLEWVVGE